MIRRKLSFVAAIAVVAMASAASAAVITLTPVIQNTYDATTGASQQAGFKNDGLPHIYRIGVIAQITGQAAGETFGLAGYDVTLGGGLSRNTLTVGSASSGLTNPKPNYVPDSPATTLIISSSGTTLANWYAGGQNGDLGSSLTDLIGLLTAIDPSNLNGLEDDNGPAPDPRVNIGTGSGTRLGAIYVKWDGTTIGTFQIGNALTASAAANKFNNSLPTVVAPLVLIPVPEPASIALMGFAGLGLVVVARRRRSA